MKLICVQLRKVQRYTVAARKQLGKPNATPLPNVVKVGNQMVKNKM